MAESNGNGNGRHGDALGVTWGDKGMTARGPLALFIVAIVFCVALISAAVWKSGERIADSQDKSAEKIATSSKENAESVIRAMADNERKSKEQHDEMARQQRIANCFNSYDFANRKRLRERAEAGELNLDAWCKWMDAIPRR